MQNPTRLDERGVALAVAVFALVIIGVLVAGTMFAGRLEQRTGTNTVFAAEAAEAAEAGVAATLTAWQPEQYNFLAIGADLPLAPVALGGGISYTPTITRLGTNLFFIRAQGARAGGGGAVLAQHQVGGLARLDLINVNAKAALTTKGLLTLGGAAVLNGYDTNPVNWTGCPPGADKYGVRSNDLINITIPLLGPTVTGSPAAKKQSDATVVDSIFDRPFDQLAALATIELSNSSYSGMTPTLTGGTPNRCSLNVATNWGEPFASPAANVAQCRNYYPTIHRNGNLSVSNGRGQGTLLVDGDLTVGAGFVFDGVIIVRGRIFLPGSADGAKISGAVMSKNNFQVDPLSLLTTLLFGKPTVNYSSCAVDRALRGTARPILLAERAWVQLY